MAIQMRRGEYDDFDASKMLAGELAVVVSGDPETEGGALYVATAAGSATRVAFANEIPGDATTTSDGLMSAADKAKLDGVAAGAQVNVIESVSVNGNSATVTGKAAAVTIPEATDAASGVMGAGDKAKLDGIAAGAKKVTITETTRGSGAQVVSFTVQKPDGTFEFPPTAVKADSNGYVDMTSVANGSIPNSKLATPYELPTMSASVKGGATVGDGLAMTGDALGIADEGVEMGMLSQEVQEAIEAGGDSRHSATSESILGADSTAQWATRESTGNGAATVRSVQGATVVWNQRALQRAGSFGINGLTFSARTDGGYDVSGTVSDNPIVQVDLLTYTEQQRTENFVIGHKYLFWPKSSFNDTVDTRFAILVYNGGADGYFEARMPKFLTVTQTPATVVFRIILSNHAGETMNTTVGFQIFDLTTMFGSGNEPATVAEFERMYPNSYYPYSAPTLKPVQIAGIESVGFNQLSADFTPCKAIDSSGQIVAHQDDYSYWATENYVHVLPSTVYYAKLADGFTVSTNAIAIAYYDSAKSFISKANGVNNTTFTTPSNARYIRLQAYFTTVQRALPSGICINISNPALNGQYKPYTTDSVEWTTQTLRAAGSVRDVLTAGELVTRVGQVTYDGTESWSFSSSIGFYRAMPSDAKGVVAGGGEAMSNLYPLAHPTSSTGFNDKTFCVSNGSLSGSNRIIVKDSSYETVDAFKAALELHPLQVTYELATPTTTPISPALPMTYRVEQGGTESIIVPAGEISATPVLTIAEGESAAELVMDALACIAAPDGPVAMANHAINTYLTMQGKLYKVTSAIAVGETITAGTNVTATTVMDEILALN